MADGEFDVVLALIPEDRGTAPAFDNVTGAVNRSAEAARGATAAADQLSAADLRRVEALAATVQAMQRQMAATAEVQRQQIILAQQVQQATGASAVEMARANQVAANVAGLQERTAIMRAQLDVALQGPAAERAWAEAEALRTRVAATGAAPGSPGAAAAEAELVAQERLAQELAAITAARERDAAAAQAEANAQRQLATTLASLQGATAQTAERTAAERQGVAAVAAYNLQLTQRNALLAAGVAEIGAQGRLVVLNEQGAAAIREQVAALQAEEAALARVKAEMADASAPGAFSRALGEVLSALKNILIYGGLIKAAQWFKEGISSATEFDTELVHMNTLAGETREQIASWSPVLLRMAGDVGVGPGELAHALYNVASNGQHGAAALAIVDSASRAAAIGLGDTAVIARAVTGAVNAYAQSGLSAAHATDVLVATVKAGGAEAQELAPVLGRVASIAATVGVSFDQVGAFVATFTRVGVGADEAVTALRQTLAALELKGAGPAREALKSVGYSVQALRKDIADNGLAVALVDLIQRFHGNTDALEKVIPNIRALAGVLSVAGSQAGEFRKVADEVKASMGNITAEAYRVTQANPGQVFAQLRASAEAAAIQVGIKLLPQLVSLSEWLRQIVREGDTSAWSSAFSAALSVLSVALAGVLLVLQNLPVVIAAVTIAMIANGSAATIWGNVVAWLSLRLEVLWATIAANPIGALAVVLGIGLIALNKWVDATRAAHQAFLDGVAKENQVSVSLGRLADSYLTVAQAARQARTEAERSSVAQAVASGAPIVLKSGDSSFEGQLAAIAQAYRDQVAAAHGAKEAIQAAEAARKADTAALQAHQQALIDDEAAALSNRAEALRGVSLQYAQANERLQQLRDAYANPMAQRPGQEIAPGQIHVQLEQAQADVQHLGNVVKVWSQQVALGTAALDAQKKQLEASRAPFAEHAAGHEKVSKAAENARFEIEKGIAARELEARSAAVLASAELRGAEAVRQATIVASADKLVEADRQRAKKAGIELTALEEQRIRASTAALSDANQVARLNQQIEASGEANQATAVTNRAKLADAIAGTALASQLAAAQLAVENAALKDGIPLTDDRVRTLTDEARARVVANAETDNAVAAVKREIAADLDRRQLAAELADIQGRTKSNSAALTEQLAVETTVRNLGAAATLKQRDAEAARVIGLQAESDSTKKQTAAEEQLAAARKTYQAALATATDDAARIALVAQYGVAVADLAVKLGAASEATRRLAIEEAVEAEVLHSKVPLTAADIAAIRQRITAQQAALAQLQAGVALVQANTDVWQPIQDGLVQMEQAGFDAFNQLVETGQVSAEAIGKSLLDILLKTFEQIFQRWLTLQAAMAATDYQGGGGGGNSGNGSSLLSAAGSGYSAYDKLTGGGGVGALSSSGGGYFSGASGAAGVAAAWAVGILAFLNLVASHHSSWAALDIAAKDGQLAASNSRGLLQNAALLAPIIDGIIKNVNAFVKQLGGMITDITGRLTIKRDGRGDNTNYQVIAQGFVQQIVNFGNNWQAAAEFAMIQAVKQSKILGLDPIVQQAIKDSVATTMKDFQADLALAIQVDNLGKSDFQLSAEKQVAAFQQMREGIEALLKPSAALTEALNKINDAENKFWTSARNQILGIQLSPDEQLHQNVIDFNQAVENERNVVTVQLTAAQIQLSAARLQLDAAAAAARENLGVNWREKDPALAQAWNDAKVLFDHWNDIVNGYLAQLAALPPPITPEEEATARQHLGQGRGGGGSSAQQRADDLARMNAELEKLARSGLPSAVGAVLDLGLQLADLTKRTHDAHASEVLLGQARQALIEQAKQALLDPVRESLLPGQGGTFGLSDFQKQAAAVDKTFADTEAANRQMIATTGQRAIAFWQLNDAHIRALSVLIGQEIQGWNLPALDAGKRVADLQQKLQDLADAFKRGALDAGEFYHVVHALQAQAGSELLGLAQSLLTAMGDSAEAAKVQRALDIADFELKRIQLNILYQGYLALGMISAAVKPILDEALAKINAFDSSKIGAPGATQGLSPADYAAAVAQDKAAFAAANGPASGLTVQQALDALAQIELQQLSPLDQAIAKVNADFASYRAVLGDTLQVQRDYALALRSVIVTALQPLQAFLDGLNTSQFSPLKALDQLAASQQTFEKAIAAVKGGDFTHLGDLTGYAQAYLQQALSSLPVGSDEYKRIEARVEAEIRAILAQYGGNPVAPPSGGPGAPPPGGGPPPPPPAVNVQPVVDAVHTTAADQLVELKEITRNTRETQQEVYALRRRLDDPITVFERVS